MDRQCGYFQTCILSLLLLCCVAGMATGEETVALMERVPCHTVIATTSHERWWQSYEYGLSHASRASWQEAAIAFQVALQDRQHDQRHIHTHCTELREYFPHRELGIAYYYLGRYLDAQRELETSLGMVETAKAKWYLNRVQTTLLQQQGNDVTPPRLQIHRPADGWITRQKLVEVTGLAQDDTSVATITINGRPLLIDLATPRVLFAEQLNLHEGTNTIDMVAGDALGQQTRQQLTVVLDRHGPLVSLDRVERLGTPPHQSVLVEGGLFDHSPITRLQLGQQHVALPAGVVQAFQIEVPVAVDTRSLPFEVVDAAGNVTRGEIDLPAPSAP